MRILNGFIVVVVLAIVLACLCRSAEAQATRTEYTGQEIPLGTISLGKQWISDGVLHIRNAQSLFQDDTTDPRVSGQVVATGNANFKLLPSTVNFYGPMHGSFVLSNSDGSWVGTWQGKLTEEGHSVLEAVGKGQGGYLGLQSRFTYTRNTPDPTAPFKIEGVILETPK